MQRISQGMEKTETLGATVLRIEILHVLLVAAVWAALFPMSIVEPQSLLFGALFMGANFLLLTFGIRWVLAPFAGKGKIKTGIALLVLKMTLFLGLGALLLFRVRVEPLSFALGFSCLLVAITFERIWAFIANE
jgi:hypothetical protein